MSIFRSDTSGQALAYRDFVQREERFVRAPYNPELEFYQAVVSGNLKKIKEMTKESFLAKKEGWGTLSANPVQNVKYHFAITAAVIARYCINAGMDLHVAYNLSDYYISAADRCHTPEEIASLHTPLCLDYTRRMKELIKQNVCSQPVVKCIDYIYDHLHTRISPIELKEKKLPSSLNIQRTAGIICIEVFDYDYAQMLCDLDVPLLFVDTPVMDMRPPLKADRLYMENRIEVQNAVAHMVQRGKKRISFAGDKNHCQSFFERYMAYKDAVEYFGLTEGLSTCAMPSGQQNYPVSLYETIRRFKTMPDAFVCANDFVAMDLVKALNELGYSVPDDIWVCGFDDSQEASYFVPRLTSIHIHEQIMGYTAANLLMTRIEEPSLNYRTVYTETNLILRESTGD